MIYLREAASAVLGLGLLFFIVNGIITTINPKIRGAIHLTIGLVLTILFVLAYFLDNYIYTTPYYPLRIYIMFAGSSLLYTIIIPTTLFVKGNREGFSFKRKKLIYTTNKNEFLYLVYKQGTQVFLKNKKGIVLKIKKTSFVDQMIEKCNQKYKLTIPEELIKKYGIVTITSKKKEVYHCYVIDVPTDLKDFGFTDYNKYELVHMDFDYLDKQIIFRLMIEEEFNVVL